MINNWEIASRIDQQTKEIRYTLLIDGTEQDARLIAKKLQGYVQPATPADAPYAYSFELPAGMDENRVEKIRSAVREGVALSQKVNRFVPGGNLGDPLFNTITQTGPGYPTFISAEPSPHPSEGNGSSSSKQSPQADLSSGHEINLNEAEPLPQLHRVSMGEDMAETKIEEVLPPQPELSDTAKSVFATQTPTAATTHNKQPAQNDTGTLSISDKDMLIEDMEGSVLEKMPLENILSAQTKYDIFLDAGKDIPPVQQTQAQKDKKMDALQAEQVDTFNVFEPKVQEPSTTTDVEEVQEITNRLAIKNMDFIKQPTPAQDAPAAPAPKPTAEATPSAENQVPFTLGSAPEEKPFISDLAEGTLPQEEVLGNTTRRTAQQGAENEDLPEITVREEPEELTQTFHLETTFNTEVIKKQHQNMVNRQEGRPVEPISEKPTPKTVLRLKKPAQPAAPQPPQAGKPVLHLRRKEAAPKEPVAPTLKSTVSAQRTAENTRLAKQKVIDHSIEIPLSELRKHNWPLEVPLVPTYTLNNMVMSVNRFAHATAISVIESPGKLYNPLVLHGGTGTGKTHFLNALAYAFSQKFGQEHIFMTNGVRLSRGIQRYVMEGNIDKFENFMDSVKALLIDDIHLLAINEQNRTFVSKLLNTFIREQKQIVITSKYPPESLEKLEELINFKLDSGWISELKPPTGATHFRIVKKMLIENGVDLNDKQIEEFFSLSHMTLGTITRSIRRLKVLENLIFPHIPKEEQSHASIFEKLLATRGEDKTSELLVKDPQEITSFSAVGNGEWGRIGFFYPQNCSDMMNWMVYALQQRAKELHIEGGFDIVVRSSYATENIISSAFKIANLCDNKKLKGAVILGPKPNTCDLSVRENFYDILTHMLEIMLIRCGIINYENVNLPSTYVKVISELMR